MTVGRGLGKGAPEPGEESGDGCRGCARGGPGGRKGNGAAGAGGPRDPKEKLARCPEAPGVAAGDPPQPASEAG